MEDEKKATENKKTTERKAKTYKEQTREVKREQKWEGGAEHKCWKRNRSREECGGRGVPIFPIIGNASVGTSM